MKNKLTLLIALLACPAGLGAHETEPLKLTHGNYKAWARHIRPSDAELVWTKIDWLPDLKSGIAKASETGKPILLWTMNGHPLGCT